MIYNNLERLTSAIQALFGHKAQRKVKRVRATRRALWTRELDAAWLPALKAAKVDHIDPALDRLLD